MLKCYPTFLSGQKLLPIKVPLHLFEIRSPLRLFNNKNAVLSLDSPNAHVSAILNSHDVSPHKIPLSLNKVSLDEFCGQCAFSGLFCANPRLLFKPLNVRAS
jgi:hypothetical protein